MRGLLVLKKTLVNTSLEKTELGLYANKFILLIFLGCPKSKVSQVYASIMDVFISRGTPKLIKVSSLLSNKALMSVGINCSDIILLVVASLLGLTPQKGKSFTTLISCNGILLIIGAGITLYYYI